MFIRFRTIPELDRLVDELHESVNRLFERDFEEGRRGRTTTKAMWEPQVEITETSEAVIADVELPGVRPKDVEVLFRDGELIIEGKRERERFDHGKYLRQERPYGKFRHVIRPDSPVDEQNITATFRQGLLTIWMPKSESATTRQISIKVSEPQNQNRKEG